jgi:outer membrane protein assembly factor BamA
VNYTNGSNESTGVKQDPLYQLYNDKPLNVGLGLIVRYDSRDIPVNAWEGMFINLSSTLYSTSLGGDNDYQVIDFDFRKYQQIMRRGIVLAFQFNSRITWGEVPYSEMSQLGTPFDLRGYTWGRFRDKSMVFAIAEGRYTFLKADRSLSQHGAVAWIATGTIFDQGLTDGTDLGWLPNFGFGYRFEVQPRMNIRLDIGIGRESSGIYFNFNEAF